MKIFVTGTRGIPDIPGGVEKHCPELYPLIPAAAVLLPFVFFVTLFYLRMH